MQHLDDVLNHLSRLRGHLEPCVKGVYGLVTEPLRREGGKGIDMVGAQPDRHRQSQLQGYVYRWRGIGGGKMSNSHHRSTPVNSNQEPKTPHPQEQVNPCLVAGYVPTS